MHHHHMAHLDLSVRNLLTDDRGHYAYIDFELSRKFGAPGGGNIPPRISQTRGTELPPEAERRELVDPYKVDIWALGILIRRACVVCTGSLILHSSFSSNLKGTGYRIAELWELTKLMLHPNFECRPSADMVLKQYVYLIGRIEESRLESPPVLQQVGL
jgi:serine/threonine protein kinase